MARTRKIVKPRGRELRTRGPNDPTDYIPKILDNHFGEKKYMFIPMVVTRKKGRRITHYVLPHKVYDNTPIHLKKELTKRGLKNVRIGMMKGTIKELQGFEVLEGGLVKHEGFNKRNSPIVVITHDNSIITPEKIQTKSRYHQTGYNPK